MRTQPSIPSVILFAALAWAAVLSAQAQSLTRGPYLQLGNNSAVTVRWRTSSTTDSVVRYGASPGNLNQAASNGTPTTEHEVRLTGLAADSTYYYSVGSSSVTLAGGADHFFVTSPISARPTRLWVIGDSGTANANAAAVRNAYVNFTGTRHTDLWLMLGDNAYNSGTDSEYQNAVFNMYPALLRTSVVWPTFGNHDGGSASSGSQSGPYYDIFTLPRQAEAGGVNSGTEAYYSFDYGNIHFVCLNSYDISRSPTGAMLTWLQNDLGQNAKDWLVAFWHHPPYSKGSHNSDTEGNLIDMRQNALPILENFGVDLVLCGHSHSYERSMFIDGHYGGSSTFSASMIVNGGSGREDGDGAYAKPALGPVPHAGAVFAVAGASGQTSGGSLNHPAMFISLNVLGSMVLDINGGRLDAIYLDNNGTVRDYFTMLKQGAGNAPPTVALTSPTQGSTFTAPADITLEAAAADSDGSVVRVDFFEDGNPVGSDTTSPYSVTWTGAPVGTHSLTALATDNLGATRLSTPVTVTVTAPGIVIVSLQKGLNGYNGMTDTKIKSDAVDVNFGAAADLEIDGTPDYAALMKWDLASIPPGSAITEVSLTFEVINPSPTPYEFYALKRAWSDSGATWNQAAAGNNWQTAGANGSNDRESTVLGSVTGTAMGTITVPLNASGLAKVQAWVNDPSSNQGFVLLDYANSDGLDLSSSEAATLGQRPMMTVTYDSNGGGNLPPTVAIASPADGASFTEPANIAIAANASDSDGSVSRVDFYADGNLIGTDNASPYAVTWNNAPVGAHSLTAVATDDEGATTTSAAVNVTVNPSGGGPITVSFQNGVNGYAGMVDTKIRSRNATSNYGTATTLEADGSPDMAILMKWDLGSIPAGAVVTAVLLTAQVSDRSSQSYEFYALNRAWVESQATWNQASTGVNWQSAGANGSNDRESTVLASVTWNATGSRTVGLNASGLAKVQSWIDQPASNHGFILLDYSVSDALDFRSSEYGTIGMRPVLTITYE